MKPNYLAVAQLLSHKHNAISRLSMEINHQLSTLRQVRNCLDDNLAEHVSHAFIKNNKLLVFADSALWASQLRFRADAVQQIFEKAYGLSLKSIKIKVLNFSVVKITQQARKAVIPSQPVINKIREQGKSMTDPELKKALTGLSNTLERLRSNQSRFSQNNGLRHR